MSQTYAKNRKAHHDYEILETFEGGLALTGQETKSIREGGAKIDGAYVTMSSGELWLMGAHFRPYSKSSTALVHQPDRSRKILVHAKELTYLIGKTQQKGLTLVPLALYSRGRQIKLSFALCRGRKTHDKREQLKQRDIERDIRRSSA